MRFFLDQLFHIEVYLILIFLIVLLGCPTLCTVAYHSMLNIYLYFFNRKINFIKNISFYYAWFLPISTPKKIFIVHSWGSWQIYPQFSYISNLSIIVTHIEPSRTYGTSSFLIIWTLHQIQQWNLQENHKFNLFNKILQNCSIFCALRVNALTMSSSWQRLYNRFANLVTKSILIFLILILGNGAYNHI